MKSMTDSVAGGGRILNASERVQWTTSMALETGGVKRGTEDGARGAERGARGAGRGARGAGR